MSRTEDSRADGPGRPAVAALDPLLRFLPCRTPAAWIEAAVEDTATLLLDHAALELRAAEQAQKLIRRYGSAPRRAGVDAAFPSRLVFRMSRLAREELRHFEQVVALIERRGGRFVAIPSSRYAAGLHALARRDEPGALVDALLIGAVIEARSCERFLSLLDPLGTRDAELAAFYASLLKSEARHFEDYLALAELAAPAMAAGRVADFLALDRELVESPDTVLRFLSGPLPPTPGSEPARGSEPYFRAAKAGL